MLEYMLEPSPYQEQERDLTTGPRNLGESLKLHSDFHSLRFLHEFKHKFVFTDPYQELDSGDYKDERDQV